MKKYFADFDHGLSDGELSKARKQYSHQITLCKDRKDINGNAVEMKLSFSEWLKIWIDSGHYKERGCKKGQYCMCRINDIGHYEIGNVFIDLASNNSSFAHSGVKNRTYGKGTLSNLYGKFGADNNKFIGTIIATCVKTNVQIHMNGQREIEQHGFIANHVYCCVNGKRKSHKGYTFSRT